MNNLLEHLIRKMQNPITLALVTIMIYFIITCRGHDKIHSFVLNEPIPSNVDKILITKCVATCMWDDYCMGVSMPGGVCEIHTDGAVQVRKSDEITLKF